MNKENAVLENRISELEDLACTQAHELDQKAGIAEPLYKLTEDYEKALAELAPMIGTEDEQFARDTMEGLKGTLETKSINVGKFIRRLDGFEVSLDNEIKRLQDRKKRTKNAVAWLKEYLKTNMERAKIGKIETALFVLSIRKNPARLNIINPDDIPPEFKTKETVIKINKAYIKEQLKQRTIAGVELVQDTRLEIK